MDCSIEAPTERQRRRFLKIDLKEIRRIVIEKRLEERVGEKLTERFVDNIACSDFELNFGERTKSRFF